MKQLLLFLFVIVTTLLYNQTPLLAQTVSISGSSGGTSVAQSSPVYIASNVNVTGTTFNGAIVSISANFASGQDALGIDGTTSGTSGGISYSYNATKGILTLTGDAVVATYQTVLRKVTYTNTSATPSTSTRSITISLNTALPYSGNGHYYEFKTSSGITWNNAKTAAEGLNYFGLKGYLATITSAEENTFCTSKLSGEGWIGASDAAEEGTWRWVTGPEGLEDSGKGRNFYTGQSPTGAAVGSNYVNWNTGEPSNSDNGYPYISSDENYAHFRTDGTWNDFPGPDDVVSSIKGYVVEYGGSSGDVIADISEVVSVNVSVPVTTAATGIQSYSFNANWNTVSGATNYYLDVATNSTFTAMVSEYSNKDVGNVTTYNVKGLNPVTQYYYRVRSTSQATGFNSNTISATTIKADQTITFDALPVKTYGVSDFSPEATASSGLTVSYTTSDPNVATIAGGLIHIVGAGTCTIYADQSGNSSYNTAPQVNRLLSVISSATISSVSPPANANYTTGQTLDFIVNFSGNVAVSGTPYLTLTIGNKTVNAPYYSGPSPSSLVFRYTVASGDADGDGIALSANISLIGSVIVDDNNDQASVTFSAAYYSGILVNALPTVTTQAVSGINVTTATGNGNITYLGIQNPSQYGVVWSTSANPTTTDSKTSQGTASSTGAFTSNITGLTAYTPYHIRAYATNSTGTNYGADVTFTTSSDVSAISGTGNWSTISQWDHGTPGSSSDVTVGTGIVTVDGNYTVNNATVNSDGALNIGTGKSLTIIGNLILKSDGTNTASLIIDGGTLAVTGTVTVERYMLGNKWYIISSTTSDKTVAQFLTANTNIPTNSFGKRGMQEYNTASNSWYDYFTSGTGNMDAGKGYAARISADGVVDFVGIPTSGDKYVPVTQSGWNCIGNPYTSAIHIDETAHLSNNFLTINASNLDPSYAAVYVWNETGTNDGIQNYYNVINNSGFSSTHAFLGQDRVQIGQGFFVKVNASATSVKFTPDMQIHENTLQLKTTKVLWPSVELSVKTDSLNAYTAIAYNDQMTLGLDPSYDAGLLRGANKLNIYSHLITDNGIDFAIQCLPEKQMENQVIPIGIDYLKGGQVKISAQVNGLPSGMNVILEDRVLKTFTALNAGNEFNVTVDPNTKGIGRFYLHTTALSVNDLKTVILAGKLNAYFSSNNEIRIIGDVSSKAIATLYDAQGKAILSQKLQESNLNVIPTSNIKTGIYMLSVRDTDKLQSFKLFIKQ